MTKKLNSDLLDVLISAKQEKTVENYAIFLILMVQNPPNIRIRIAFGGSTIFEIHRLSLRKDRERAFEPVTAQVKEAEGGSLCSTPD